jgi:hypothetical protein
MERMQLKVACVEKLCKAASRNWTELSLKMAGVGERADWKLLQTCNSGFQQRRCAAGKANERGGSRLMLSAVRKLVRCASFVASKALRVVCALIIANGLSVTNLNADESQAALCAKKVRGFVESIDELLSGNANDVHVFGEPIRKYLPVKGCNVDEVISIARTSKFFSEAYDWSPAYTIIFRSLRFDITFGLRKDTGNIEYPAAQVRFLTR